ncbi:uncharacterized protein LOC115970690 [Quercus lobata]|uniref:uncharacterized protein LOC115970690 n=1 Tax=Quercus lobata TaxID=97700 RepID=UPI00124753B8|nr:uncharacterized protein LOC115970690 [Quercus lobata]
MDCIDLTYGFFLVRFYFKDDLERVIKRGLWFIGDHFLSLRPWEPFFKPAMANVSLVAAWIRLNALPIELYETEVLKKIGDSIGKVLRIDSHTTLEARGRYARLCIQIDINKPLVNSILIGRFEQVVTYEGIHKLCFSCGRVGHKIEACPYTIRKDKEKEPEAPRKETADEGSADLQNLHGAVTHNACEATDVEGHYGPWMLVSRKGNGQKGKRTENGTGRGSGISGSSAWLPSNHLPPVFAEAASPCVESSEKKITNPPLTQPSASCSVSNISAGTTFEFSATTNVKTGSFVGRENDRNLQIQATGEKSHADEHMEFDEGVQISSQSSDSEVGSLVEVHMVSDGGGLVEDRMVSDEGNGAAPFL